MDDKKIAAAISAVMAYIKNEEEAIAASGMLARPAVISPAPPVAPLKMWGISGRQAMMQMRNLMQMKALK